MYPIIANSINVHFDMKSAHSIAPISLLKAAIRIASFIGVVGICAVHLDAQQVSIQSSKGIRSSAGVSLRAIRAYLEAPKRITVVAQQKRMTKQNPAVIVVHNPQAVMNELLQVKPPKTHLVR